ncbi:MAG: diguanylate cyclase [Sideroxydans sp.]|nr:diguanylate cyclase [Sideroxydans sp.]
MKQKIKILVVDDDPNLRKTLADILRVKDYETAVAATGAEAIAASQQAAFSLALIDLKLPDMSGIEVMKKIKAVSPLTEAIILTGYASMDSAIEATKQGAYSYLLKPYQMDDLLQSIRHGVERQQAQDEILRLASFPRLHPNPVVELNAAGEVTYINPAAEKQFPDLGALEQAHPLLNELAGPITELRKSGKQTEISCEAMIDDATYELHVSYVRDVDLIRIYVTDITQRKRDEAEIHLLATTDSLTGIANRREFTRVLNGEMERAKRYGTPLSLAMYDIDYFKRVNDSFGHDAGDYVLQALTRLVQQNIRNNVDVVSRWGGEEFMLLMPQSNLAAAKIAADKLRQAIARFDFDKVGAITVSFGVTEFVMQDDINALLKRLDDALYQAKEHGRNRVEALAQSDAASGEIQHG